MQIFILFHSRIARPFQPCTDGLFAAFAARSAFPGSRLIPVGYGHPPELDLSPGDTVYLLDVSYPAHILDGWADAGVKVSPITVAFKEERCGV